MVDFSEGSNKFHISKDDIVRINGEIQGESQLDNSLESCFICGDAAICKLHIEHNLFEGIVPLYALCDEHISEITIFIEEKAPKIDPNQLSLFDIERD